MSRRAARDSRFRLLTREDRVLRQVGAATPSERRLSNDDVRLQKDIDCHKMESALEKGFG